MKQETKPCVVGALESCDDYGVRAEALRIILSGTGDPVRQLLSRMAYAGVLEYYGGWDDELTRWCLEREFGVARDLATIEAQLLPKHEGTPEELKAKMKAEEQEICAAMDTGTPPPQPRRLKLPPGTRPDATTLRALAILRRREMEDE